MLSTSAYSYQYGTRRRLANDDIVGATVFPTGTAGNGHLQIDPFTGVPDMYRCADCGMGCVIEDGVTSPGTFNNGDGFITNNPTTGDPTVLQGGCPFCGSPNSRKIETSRN